MISTSHGDLTLAEFLRRWIEFLRRWLTSLLLRRSRSLTDPGQLASNQFGVGSIPTGSSNYTSIQRTPSEVLITKEAVARRQVAEKEINRQLGILCDRRLGLQQRDVRDSEARRQLESGEVKFSW